MQKNVWKLVKGKWVKIERFESDLKMTLSFDFWVFSDFLFKNADFAWELVHLFYDY